MRFGGGRGGGRRRDDGPDAPAQIALGALADPAAIDIEPELGRTLQENGAGIAESDQHDPAEGATLDEVVDSPPLQFERHDIEQKHDDRQQRQQRLVNRARRDDIAEDVGGQSGCDRQSRSRHAGESNAEGIKH